MKKLRLIIRRWRYHRLYQRLLWHYLPLTDTADAAGYQAALAFSWLTGREWKNVIKQ